MHRWIFSAQQIQATFRGEFLSETRIDSGGHGVLRFAQDDSFFGSAAKSKRQKPPLLANSARSGVPRALFRPFHVTLRSAPARLLVRVDA